MKLLGWKVTRNTGTEKESSHEVWVGFTDEALAARKEFILTSCYDELFDGAISFDRVESDVIVDGLGLYHCEGMPHGFRVAKATPTECFGYSQRRTPKGRLRDGVCFWFYVNGVNSSLKPYRITGRAA